MTEDSTPLSSLSMKLPPFWPADPHLWFAQLEAQFHTCNITAQKTKLAYVVASLSPETPAEVRDLILDPPTSEPYDVLRANLIQRVSVSKQRHFRQLLAEEELGDQKSSRLLRRMQRLQGDSASARNNPLFQELFLHCLPSNVRMILASTTPTDDVQELADGADKIMEVSESSKAVENMEEPGPQEPSLHSEVNQLRTDVADLKKLLKTLASAPQRTGTRPHGHTPTVPDSQLHLCWYHYRFGDAAKKCKPPCTKSGNFQASH